MFRVTTINDGSPHDVNVIAVSACNKGGHVGIIYHEDDSGTVSHLHLAWHNKLKNKKIENPHIIEAWVEPNLDESRMLGVESIIRLIWKKNSTGEIAYAFSRPDGFFDSEGMRSNDPLKVGLTCSSFVLSAFNAAGIDLIEYESWPIRTSDSVWQEKIILDLKNNPPGITDEECETVANEIGVAVRFKPLETVGAVYDGQYPVVFEEAVSAASVIESILCPLEGS